MVRVGLVAYVEEQLERDIALRRLPRNGGLASERKMARRYGVCRGTVREALRRLAARGLVVLRPGRQARAVALDESLTLENLGLALHDTRTQESRRLLEGFFSLKRQVLVELLSDCCAHASDLALGPLESTCYALQDAARWYHPKERCAQLEFELLRLSAQVASRPGHLLLIQSLQRAFRGIADRLLPFMGGDAMRQWVICALDALYARDVQALQHQLPALMKTYDELVLDQFAPVPQERASPDGDHAQESNPGAPASDSAQDDVPTARAGVEEHDLRASASATAQDDAFEARSCTEERGVGSLAPANELLGVAPCSHGRALSMGPDSGALLFSAVPELARCELDGKRTGETETNAALGNLSGCWTGCNASSREACHKRGGSLRGPLRRWAAHLWRFIARSPGPPAS
ncbi:FadR/GntR family transcriptional regulator [Corallococcus aberystwythensis]|uniref:GntR family transcriptional regulator n=1 Tax=Corallococcus aberystwythensis TaxID=2316722 RepID=A0A3A8QZB5_9BACT|nr:GntR family transcriptional regulator [Corallococcus aberystwythensis]RKH68474.1 GntR family transcriptional regulator [Corallococcus aberystwythensis]